VITCGIWLARRRLVAVIIGPAGEARRPVRAARTAEARYGLVEYLAAAEAEILLGAAAIRDPARAAALLARLPRIPLLRAYLRRLMPPGAPARQLPLL
jgi:hypothetical protein